MNNETRTRCLLLLAGLVAYGGVAQAEESASLQARLLVCDGIVGKDEKLACFNAIVDSLDRSAPRAAQASEPQRHAEPTPTASVPAVSGPVAEAATPQPDSDYGLTPKKERKAEAESFAATIVRVWMHHDERFSVELDNGQRWRETQGTRVGKPKEGAMVTVSPGSFGSFRMKIDGISRKAWVRRTR